MSFLMKDRGTMRQKMSIFKQGNSVSRDIQLLNTDPITLSKGKYKHFMEKEIFEQPEVISQVLGSYLNASKETLTLPPLPKSSEIKRILLIGCGTAFYSCLIAKYWFESISGVPTNAELASEFRYRSPVLNKDDLLVFEYCGQILFYILYHYLHK